MTQKVFTIAWDNDDANLMGIGNLIDCLQFSCPDEPFKIVDVLNDHSIVCKPLPEPSSFAIHIAAQIWCNKQMIDQVMDTEAAMKIARIIDGVLNNSLEKTNASN